MFHAMIEILMLMKNKITTMENHRLRIQESVKFTSIKRYNASKYNQELTKDTKNTSDRQNSSNLENYNLSLNLVNLWKRIPISLYDQSKTLHEVTLG